MAVKCREIANIIETLAPRELAYPWDNVGLLCGDREGEVTKILLTLDLDEGVCDEAVRIGAQLIIGHHPIMFEKINKITSDTPEGRLLMKMMKNGISYYAAHTNLDVAKGGLNDLLAKKTGLEKVEILEAVDVPGEGIGRVGYLKEKTTLHDLMAHMKKTLSCGGIRFCGDENRIVSKVAVNTGGGTALINAALSCGADVFITGDYKYNQMRDCTAEGMAIVDIGHYDTEFIVCELFENYLSKKLDGVEIAVTKSNTNVMKFF